MKSAVKFLCVLAIPYLVLAHLSIGGIGFPQAIAASADKLKEGDVVKVDIDDLHPTQTRVGQAEVDEKAQNFESMSADDLESYLKHHPCPVVIGPGGIPYITDEQHRANASEIAEKKQAKFSSLLNHGKPTMYMQVIHNWSDKSDQKFEKKMIEDNLSYLKDLGEAVSFDQLPKHVDEMKDDPYRSLAGFLENTAWKEKKNVYFIQFVVAEWLRENLKMSENQVSSALTGPGKALLLKSATAILQSSKAKSEAWYLKP